MQEGYSLVDLLSFLVNAGLQKDSFLELLTLYLDMSEMVESGITEVVFALTPSIANDAVILYIEDKLDDYDVLFTRIAQGVPTGVSLENVDMLSLARALEDRVKV